MTCKDFLISLAKISVKKYSRSLTTKTKSNYRNGVHNYCLALTCLHLPLISERPSYAKSHDPRNDLDMIFACVQCTQYSDFNFDSER